MAGAIYQDPQLEQRRRQLEGDRDRLQAAEDMRKSQQDIAQQELLNNQLRAQQFALDNSAGMQANSNIPRQVTDTSMTIPDGSYAPNSTGGSGSRGPATGGFGTSVPQIDGRYMSLVEFKPPATTTTPQPSVSMGPGTFGPADATAYQNAAFARLKDKSGQLGQGAVESLAAQLAGRGISGQSGTFGRGLADIVSRSVQPLADLNVAHLGQEYDAAGRERQLSEARANAEYQGGIAQRGQNVSSQQALNSLLAQLAMGEYQGGISQRGQDLESLYRLL